MANSYTLRFHCFRSNGRRRYTDLRCVKLQLQVESFVTVIEVVKLCYNNFNATATVSS
jgi:hypothetical protein